MMQNFNDYNARILTLMSLYINECPTAIDEKMMTDTLEYCGVDKERAFCILLGGILNVYNDRRFMKLYIEPMVKLLDAKQYTDNDYIKHIRINNAKSGDWKLAEAKYAPYEAFVYNESRITDDGRLIPCIGFFDCEYTFPCVMQDEREWMLITPNEIETMKKPIEKAHGDVLTYGLGLGYFPFMTSQKENVKSVTVVEKDATVIKLFEENILSQFPHKEKIKIVNADAFEYATTMPKYDFVFADIWHDPSDGINAYKKFKSLERLDVEYSYWIEDTIKYYMK